MMKNNELVQNIKKYYKCMINAFRRGRLGDDKYYEMDDAIEAAINCALKKLSVLIIYKSIYVEPVIGNNQE